MCANRARFHLHLAKYGKTNVTEEERLLMVSNHYHPYHYTLLLSKFILIRMIQGRSNRVHLKTEQIIPTEVS